MLADLAYAWRSMRKSPGFAAVAVISLALGIGANLAVFSVLYRLVVTKLPGVQDPDRLYQIVVVQTNGPHYTNPFPKFEVMRDNLDVFKPLFGWGGFARDLTAGDWKGEAQVTGVTGNYFEALGVRPAIGRLLISRDEQEHASDIAAISYRFWQTAFGGDPGVLGRRITVQDATFSIVGVAAPDFTGTEPAAPPAVYLPPHAYARLAPNALTGPGFLWFHIMGRLPADARTGEVQTMLRERWAELDEPNRLRFTRNSHDYLVLEDGSHGYSAARLEFSSAVLVLMGLVGAVLLVACANLATLLFVRGAGRMRETSIRLALGASRARLVRQWMAECLLLAVLGGAAGLVAARWITDLLLRFVAEADRPWLQFHANSLVVLVSVALSLVAGMLAGLLPALRATGVRLEPALRAQSATLTGRRGILAKSVLAGQLAVSLVLVIGAGLFARSLWNLNTDSGGFDRRAVVYAIPDFAAAGVPRERQANLVEAAVNRLSRSQLVAQASMGNPPMVYGDSSFGYVTGVTGYALGPDEDNTAYTKVAAPGYFGALGIALAAGRDFEEQDRPASGQQGRVAIVNRHLARHYFGDRSPIGETIVMNGPPLEIVGLVEDTRNGSLRDPQKDIVYRPIAIGGWNPVLARARAGVPVSAVQAEMHAAFAAAAPQLPVDIQPLEEAVQRSLGRDRLVAQLSASLGLLGVLLASIGLYGAIAHSVSGRTREIGIRMAVGADARDVAWMVLKEGLVVTGAGLLVGLPVAAAGSRLAAPLLFGVSPWDPTTLAASAGTLMGVALAAGFWPARRAALLDPSRTLRCE